MKIWRITFTHAQSETIDVQADIMIFAIHEGLKFLQSRGHTYKIEHCVKAELVAEPITTKEECK